MKTENNPKVIADTCVWIEFFRTKSETSNRLRDLIAHSSVVGIGIIIAELLQGITVNKERKIIIDIFNTIEYLEVTKDIWIEAGILSKKLRSLGKIIPLSDIIIACCAKKHQCQIFTIDQHFQVIPDLNIF